MTEPRLTLGLCLDRREGFRCEILVEVANLGRLGDKRFERRFRVYSIVSSMNLSGDFTPASFSKYALLASNDDFA